MARTSSAPPSSGGEQRLTPRQRRIEEQRARIETLRREQRRKRALWGTGILAAFAAIAAATFMTIRPPVQVDARQVPTEGAEHVQAGTPLPSRNRPPSSGTHYPTTSGYGFFERDVEPGYWLHTLEHGGVVVLYNPDTCDQGCQSQLRSIQQSAPASQTFRTMKMAVIPYRDMDKAITAVAWGWVLEMDQPDRDQILGFYRQFVDRGPELAP